MKKQELIHLHGLLAQVQQYYQRQTDQTVDTAQYAAVGVQPTSIHRSKAAHQDAVVTLSQCLTAAMADDALSPVSATAD